MSATFPEQTLAPPPIATLGELIRFYREQQNIDQKQLAEMTDTQPSMLSRLENDKIKKPKKSLLSKIAHSLKIPEDLLLLERQEPTARQEKIKLCIPSDVIWSAPFSYTPEECPVQIEKMEFDAVLKTVESGQAEFALLPERFHVESHQVLPLWRILEAELEAFGIGIVVPGIKHKDEKVVGLIESCHLREVEFFLEKLIEDPARLNKHYQERGNRIASKFLSQINVPSQVKKDATWLLQYVVKQGELVQAALKMKKDISKEVLGLDPTLGQALLENWETIQLLLGFVWELFALPVLDHTSPIGKKINRDPFSGFLDVHGASMVRLGRLGVDVNEEKLVEIGFPFGKKGETARCVIVLGPEPLLTHSCNKIGDVLQHNDFQRYYSLQDEYPANGIKIVFDLVVKSTVSISEALLVKIENEIHQAILNFQQALEDLKEEVDHFEEEKVIGRKALERYLVRNMKDPNNRQEQLDFIKRGIQSFEDDINEEFQPILQKIEQNPFINRLSAFYGLDPLVCFYALRKLRFQLLRFPGLSLSR